jgi:hypothetical protein
MELGDVTHHNVMQLKRVNQVIFPVSYNDKFYKDVVNAGELAKLGMVHVRVFSVDLLFAAYFNDIVVGGVCCRIDLTCKRRMYIMTLGTLAPYRRFGLGIVSKRFTIVQFYSFNRIINAQTYFYTVQQGFDY